MTYEEMDDVARWSPAGQAMAWVVAGEVVLAITAITQGQFHRPRVLVVAAALAILSAIVTSRTRMPQAAKGGSITLLCAALLALAASQDPFGLRAVDRSVAAAITGTDAVPAVPVTDGQGATPAAMAQLSLRGGGDVAAVVFADDLARQVAAKRGDDAGGYRVDGLVDITAAPSGDAYRLTWSLSDYAQTLWCGRIVAIGQSRSAALDSFSTTIATALRRTRRGAAACG